MKAKALVAASLSLAASVALGAAGFAIGRQFQDNHLCCAVPAYRNVRLSVRQLLGLVRFHSQIGQDIWVLETALPGVRDGYFLDVGSGDGTVASNTKALEERGWKGICVDPFPTHMEGRACQMFKEVVYSEAGKRMTFHTAGELGGLAKTLGEWKAYAEKSPTVEFTTVTLGDILARAKAPQRIDFMSLDIEGAELERAGRRAQLRRAQAQPDSRAAGEPRICQGAHLVSGRLLRAAPPVPLTGVMRRDEDV